MKTKRINAREADSLLEKYYDGLTTKAEEQLLQQFLQQDGLSAKYDPDKAILGYFAANKTHGSVQTGQPAATLPISPRKRWLYPSLIGSGAVAATLALLFTFSGLTQATAGNYAYIHGKRVTDKEQLTLTVQSTIDLLGTPSDEVEASVSLLDTERDLLQEQLQVFF